MKREELVKLGKRRDCIFELCLECIVLFGAIAKLGLDGIVSPVHIKEIEAIPDEIERIQLLTLLEKYGAKVNVNLKQVRESRGIS